MCLNARGLSVQPSGPLGIKKSAKDYPYCFRPYRTALEMLKYVRMCWMKLRICTHGIAHNYCTFVHTYIHT